MQHHNTNNEHEKSKKSILPDGAEVYKCISSGRTLNKKQRQISMKKVYETGSISTLYEMKSFFTAIRELYPEIDAFISSHELINNAISDNECYSIKFGARKTVLYLKQS